MQHPPLFSRMPYLLMVWMGLPLAQAEAVRPISGVYPHLRMWNNEGECGTGAVVVWQGDLWAITYAPHKPGGSSDKLYQVTPELEQIIYPESVGGTPANRMIHDPSQQLLIGPYLIDARKNIRVIPPSRMFGRLTGNAAHLTDPANKVYYATMEEGLYEVDVRSLDVTCLIRDGNGGAPAEGLPTKLPGYHGKGLYSSQGILVYTNNGEHGGKAQSDPTTASGALAQWMGSGDWQLVRRNQFTEVSGPGGIHGPSNPEKDALWAMGWDARSLILALLEDKEWHFYRLPKGSHSYDGAHGWNTEWPRIREIAEKDLLATMHGTFWKFPATFSRKNSAGIRPRSNYLKVIGDFCRWGDRLVLGCDDSAQKEFLNTRPFKAEKGAPLQSNSNLWFVEPELLDQLGPAIGRGSVWLREDVEKGQASDPYLFDGYAHRCLHLIHATDHPVEFQLEVDRDGTDTWSPLRKVSLESHGATTLFFTAADRGAWIRLVPQSDAKEVSAHFQYRNPDPRPTANDPMFAGIARTGEIPARTGVMRSLAYNRLAVVAGADPEAKDAKLVELNSALEFSGPGDRGAMNQLLHDVRQPDRSYQVDNASVILIEDGQRWRLPKNVGLSPSATPIGETKGASAKEPLSAILARSLTHGKPVTVSSTQDAYQAAFAVDGIADQDDRRWVSKNEGPSWVEIDLGAPTPIQNIWVVSGWKKDPQFTARNFRVEVQQKGTWETFPGGEIQGNRQILRSLVAPEPVPAEKIRVISTDEGHFRIYEVAAFSKEELPASAPASTGYGPARICREIATERDLLNLHGTFYELPARNAQGMAKIRPIATHNLAIQDYCSHNGLLFMTGLDATSTGEHILRSEDGQVALWAGVIDDLWRMGKPRGKGGPWNHHAVKANQPSDPYLMTGFDKKSVEIKTRDACQLRLELDVDGTGLWIPWQTFRLDAGQTATHVFPEDLSAYWIRAVTDRDTEATVMLEYQ